MNTSDIIAAGQAVVDAVGMPLMAKPTVPEAEYRFPTDPSTLSSQQLGSLSLRLTAWLSWTNIELGKIDSELGVIKPMFDIVLSSKILDLKEISPKLTKEEGKAQLLNTDASIQRAFSRINILTFAKTRLEAQTKVYESQLSKLSREQSRREGEKVD